MELYSYGFRDEYGYNDFEPKHLKKTGRSGAQFKAQDRIGSSEEAEPIPEKTARSGETSLSHMDSTMEEDTVVDEVQPVSYQARVFCSHFRLVFRGKGYKPN